MTSHARISKPILQNQTLTVVGSGISGLMTAWQAAKAGMQVALYSKSPDPRTVSDGNAEQESSTFDSRNDQRYITLFEGHPYLELVGYIDKMYPGIADDFGRDVLQGGLLTVPQEKFPARSIQWLKRRAALNRKLQNGDREKIAEIRGLFASYADENRAAMAAWYEILADLLNAYPALVQTLTLSNNGVMRLYDDREVFEEARKSHQEGGVFKCEYTPEELVSAYPAYAEGVKRGFIRGGAIEMYGLTFGVQAVGRCLIDEMERMDVEIHFNNKVTGIERDGSGAVKGILIEGQAVLRQSDHYIFHTGAFAGPELFQNVPQAQNELAAVEGYWLTIENADQLIQAMGDKPNKVHGKKSLAEILEMVDDSSAERCRQHFNRLGIADAQLSAIAPIVDFNNMPIHKNGTVSLGVGSGYIFKGLAECDATGRACFTNDAMSEEFTLIVMELWLEALHGKRLLTDGAKTVVHRKGCKRSWTPNDRELDVNLPTISGGLCMMHDGGNTGSTTKSPFIAAYALAKIARAEKAGQGFAPLRRSLGKSVEEIGPEQWEKLTAKLARVLVEAQNKSVQPE